MTPIEIKGLTFASLSALAANVEAEITNRVKQWPEVAARFGISLPTVSNGHRPSGRKVYRDPKSGAMYTAGYGRPPAWYSKAKNKAALLVKEDK